jgi:hypothetical protein
MRSLLVSLSFLVAVMGCAASGIGPDSVENKWASRDALPSCGEITLTHDDSLDQVGEEGVACLRAALESGEGAELKVTFYTVEGDAISVYHKVTPDGTVEVYTDSTQDKFGEQRWTHRTCEDVTPLRVLDC